jgi:hypothetical protein
VADKRIAFRCYRPECAGEPPTEIIVKVPKTAAVGSGEKEKLVYCEHCNHPNLITLPDTWDAEQLVLGRDIVAYSHGLPVLQGRRP